MCEYGVLDEVDCTCARHFKAHAQSIKKSSDASGIEVGVSSKKAFHRLQAEVGNDPGSQEKTWGKKATRRLHRVAVYLC